MGLRNSSSRISPGCGLRSKSALAVVVDDLDMCRSSFIPYETDSPLVVDSDRMLPLAISPQCLKPIAGRNAKIDQRSSLIQETKFPQRNVLNIWRQLAASSSRPDQLRFGIGKAPDHGRQL